MMESDIKVLRTGMEENVVLLPVFLSLLFHLYFDVSSVFVRAWKLPWYLRNLNSNPVFRQSAGHSGSLATKGKVIICNGSPSITPDHSDTLPKEAVA